MGRPGRCLKPLTKDKTPRLTPTMGGSDLIIMDKMRTYPILRSHLSIFQGGQPKGIGVMGEHNKPVTN